MPRETETFGEAMRRWRRGRGLTQEEVARGLSVVTSTVSRWERNQTAPDARTAAMIDDYLDARGEILSASGYSPEMVGWRMREQGLLAEAVVELTEEVRRQAAKIDDLTHRIDRIASQNTSEG